MQIKDVEVTRSSPATPARRAARVVLMLALVLASACMGNKTDEEPAEPVPVTRLRVDNQAYLDMTVYVYRSSQRIRLGTVSGSSTTRLVIPSNLMFGTTSLRFQADPIGASRQPISQEISVSPGDEVILIIPP